MQQIQRRIFYIGILVASLAWIFISADRAGTSTSGQIPAPREDFLAPDFSLPALDGRTVRLSDFRGQAVLVNLWATWCPPCRAEMPAIQKLYEEYQDRGFVVLAVNMTYQDNSQAVAPFVEEYKLTFPILLEGTGDMARDYELRSLPSSFFINPDGSIEEVVIGGPMAEALLRTRIEGILP